MTTAAAPVASQSVAAVATPDPTTMTGRTKRKLTSPAASATALIIALLWTIPTAGLFISSFRPAEEIAILRSYLRQRAMLIRYAAAHVQHMQKALQQMNVLLHQVVRDITGLTGMTIIRAIVAGERDPQVLAQHRDYRCRRSADEIAQSLTGNYRAEHVFALRQALALYDSYQEQIALCDQQIEQYLTRTT